MHNSNDETGKWSANNYHPLPVEIATALGAWVWDVDGRRYLDCLAGYSALNFGHRHPVLMTAAYQQMGRVTLTSRAFLHDQFNPFCKELAQLCDMDQALPMNTGAEAVETGIKVARAWGYRVKGVPQNQANIIVMKENFHGRTTTIISFSTDPDAHNDFGPYTPGFRTVTYGDVAELAAAIDENTVAVLIEPIQGEAGVVVPPFGYLSAVRQLCTDTNVLMIADEVQSGLGRTGLTFACDFEGVRPDAYLLGKALGGGIVPVSAMVGTNEVMGVLRPGEHGSTFGGNPLACAIARAVVGLLKTGEYQERAKRLGEHMLTRLHGLVGYGVTDVRGRGLWAGIDIDPKLMTGRQACKLLLDRQVLTKDTHGQTVRLSPPLVATLDDLEYALAQFRAVLATARG
jgi:ornithine--oxo-acid transaminase